MSQAFPAKYFYHFELKVNSKELCGVRWTDAVDGRKHYAQKALNERLRAALLRRSSEVFFLLVQQVSDVHEVVCKHSGADQHLKALRSLGQTALHAGGRERARRCGPQCLPKRCPFLKSGSFQALPFLGGPFAPHCGMQTSFTAPSWHAWMFSSLKKPRSELYQSGAKPKVS